MNYEILMRECINLAKLGEGKTSPNPLVGAVVLDKNNNIISKGYHQKYGENHAERNALINLSDEQCIGGTVIVNLEPCSHYGKTPPCADLIIEKGIKKVVIGMCDVNPIVAGNGIKKLKAADIEVIEGVLEDECKKLNEIFIKNMTEHKTFVAIKSASTLDGKISTSRGISKWITSENARNEGKRLRLKYDAIMTSSSTIIADNPSMLHNKKVIIDRELKTDFLTSEIYKSGISYVFYDKNISPERTERVLSAIKQNDSIILYPSEVSANKIDLGFVLNKLYELGIMSVFVEAGGHLNGSMLKYADKIYQFIAPKILGDNTGLSSYNHRIADTLDDINNFRIDSAEIFPPDILLTLYPVK